LIVTAQPNESDKCVTMFVVTRFLPALPILVITTTGNNFTQYYQEILRAEGFNNFNAMDITQNSVGTNGGQAAAFTFDLARSIVYTRQGNPVWAGQDRDGIPPIRKNDLFFGGADPDWVNLDKVAIPQADEL
jgi:hypothetical protein